MAPWREHRGADFANVSRLDAFEHRAERDAQPSAERDARGGAAC
jgi:hypothetical protein